MAVTLLENFFLCWTPGRRCLGNHIFVLVVVLFLSRKYIWLDTSVELDVCLVWGSTRTGMWLHCLLLLVKVKYESYGYQIKRISFAGWRLIRISSIVGVEATSNFTGFWNLGYLSIICPIRDALSLKRGVCSL